MIDDTKEVAKFKCRENETAALLDELPSFASDKFLDKGVTVVSLMRTVAICIPPLV